jgi:hypothetical protein
MSDRTWAMLTSNVFDPAEVLSTNPAVWPGRRA